MQVEKSVNSEIMKNPFEHENIRQRLAGKFRYFDGEQKRWYTFTNFCNPTCTEETIKIRCKWAKQTITLPYPFELSEGLLYLWGLIVGSAYKKDQLEICVDACQEETINSIVSKLGFEIQTLKVTKPRKKYNSPRIPRYYRKVRVKFPSEFLKFLKCLGYRQNKPSIPAWFTEQQKSIWLEGYLNSSKLQCRIRKGRNIAPKVQVFILNNEIKLLLGISEILDSFNVSHSIYQTQDRVRIVIQQISSIFNLVVNFSIYRPKFRALSAILKKSEEQPALRMSLQKLPISDFQLTLFGIALDNGNGELEYTIFENALATSSNQIRTNLYQLNEWGLIHYYKKENNREFLRLENQYLHYINQILKEEELELRNLLKLSDSNALSFYCKGCDVILSYLEAIGENSFGCPRCGEKTLQPLDISRHSYYGKLGHLAVQCRIIQGASI